MPSMSRAGCHNRSPSRSMPRASSPEPAAIVRPWRTDTSAWSRWPAAGSASTSTTRSKRSSARPMRWRGLRYQSLSEVLDQPRRRLALAIEVLCGPRHGVGQPGSMVSAAALQADRDHAHDANRDAQDDDHGDDDGRHERLPFKVERAESRERAACGLFGESFPTKTSDAAQPVPSGGSRFGYGSRPDQAAGSRNRWEITAETPSPRIVTPYRASAISIVRFWCVITSSWLLTRSSS